MKKDNNMCSDCVWNFDLMDRLLILLFAILVLLANIGIMSIAWLAYWPVFVIVWVVKEFLNE